MNVIRNNLGILTDNEENYLLHLQNVIGAVEELANIEIWLNGDRMHFRIGATFPKYNKLLLEELLKFHNIIGIKLDLGKSIKTSGIISYDINLK